MLNRAAALAVAATLAVGVTATTSRPVRAAAVADRLPSRLTDAEFWTLAADLSEVGGTFRSENLLSNESRLQFVIPELLKTAKPEGAYVGVGPEQNFTYIAALRPSIAFIVDIRRGNFQLHLMYKALFDLSADRPDFVSRLFSRPRPDGLENAAATAADIFTAYADSHPDEDLYATNLAAIEHQLADVHGFALSADDWRGIAHIYHAFFTFGPRINYSSSETASTDTGYRPTYADLMVATDAFGEARSYLASEPAFAAVKAMQARNLIVPVVGDFAGPKALRAVAAYLKRSSTMVSAFYVSNVEQYLRLERVWGSFCSNAARLPIDEASLFIRAGRGGRYSRGTALTAELAPIAAEVEGCDRRP
jgi:hypothetical protein